MCRDKGHVVIPKDGLFDFVSILKVNEILLDYIHGRCTDKFHNLYETTEPLLLSNWATRFGATYEIQDASGFAEPYISPR